MSDWACGLAIVSVVMAILFIESALEERRDRKFKQEYDRNRIDNWYLD